MHLKRYIVVLMFLVLYVQFKAQVNLVPNGSFEDTVSTIACSPQMTIYKSTDWYRQSNGSPDYINVCANSHGTYPYVGTIPQTCYGYQYPKTGNAMVGAGTYLVNTDSINYMCEYISVKLKDTLKANTYYYGEFYASLANLSERAVNRLGAYISNGPFVASTSSTVYSFTNTINTQIEFDTTQYFTDTLNWTKISNTFMAQGGETHLTIGSFKDGTHVKKTAISTTFTLQCNLSGSHAFSYFYIDDVYLEKLENALAGNDTTLNCGDSTLIGKNTSTVSGYTWTPTNGLSNAHIARPMASPTVSNTYTLTKQTGTTITTDVIVLNVTNIHCDVGLKELYQNNNIKVYPNPTDQELNIELALSDHQKGVIEIYNLLGSLIKVQSLQNGVTSLDVKELDAGTYFYCIKVNNTTVRQDKLMIIK